METALTTILSARVERTAEAVSPASFDRIVRQHQRRVHRVIWLLVKDRDAADTLTQECFLRAYQNLSTFRGECRMDTWLLRIAVNLARDHGKNRRLSFWRKLVGIEEAPQAESTPAFEPSPERSLLAREQLQAVWDTSASLSQQQKAVFLLRFVEEMSLVEIAEALDMKVGSVKTQLFRALASVRKKLKE